jgi:ATP-dependent Clp protease ATP-binding subunit ClpA
MFERFTGEARTVVAGAQDQARALRHPFIGPEHLLLAMLTHGDGVGGKVLRARGMTAAALRDRLSNWDGPNSRLDPDALAILGIDLGAVRRAAEAQFGPGALAPDARPMPQGHIPFSPAAKKVLELAVREAVAVRSTSINSGHLLLAVIGEKGGAGLIRDAGVELDELSVETRIRAARQVA